MAEAITAIVGYLASAIYSVAAYAVIVAVGYAYSVDRQRAAARKARDAYNAGLQDRTITLKAPVAQSRMLLGRVRVGGVLVNAMTVGVHREKLAMVIALAGHECDAIEQIYFDNVPVTLNGDGYVTDAPYSRTDYGSASQTATVGIVTELEHVPVEGTVLILADAGEGTINGIEVISVIGNVVTHAPVTGNATISYQWAETSRRAQVIKHLGAPGQVVDPTLQALLPVEWDASHKGEGICYLVGIFDYNQDAFPQGLPEISAVVRGAKCYDPRTATTTWTENPALHMRYYTLSPIGARLSTAVIDDAQIIAAANVCDTVVTYDDGLTEDTGPLYKSALMATTDQAPKEILDQLAQAMAGRWLVTGDKLRIKAGSYVSPVLTLSDGDFRPGTFQVQPRLPREQLINTITGQFSDPVNGFQVVDFPLVEADEYIAEDGGVLSFEVTFPAIGRAGQCQQVSAVMIREARQAMTLVTVFGLAAYPVDVFDTIAITNVRYGWSAKPFEVMGRRWTLEGGIELTLRETAASVYDFGLTFDPTYGGDNTLLPTPWYSPPITGLRARPGGTTYVDGQIVTRTIIEWDTVTDPGVRSGGHVELQFARIGEGTFGVEWVNEDDDPAVWETATSVEAIWDGVRNTAAGDWGARIEPGDAVRSVLLGLSPDGFYLLRARTNNGMANSIWTPHLLMVVGGLPLVDTPGLAPDAATSVYNVPTVVGPINFSTTG